MSDPLQRPDPDALLARLEADGSLTLLVSSTEVGQGARTVFAQIVAEELGVKESTVETYIKRAAVKLGISGRHGLTKWMIDDCTTYASAA